MNLDLVEMVSVMFHLFTVYITYEAIILMGEAAVTLCQNKKSLS